MEYFKEEPRGTVVAMEPEEFTGAIYHIWFPYARSYMSEVREGGLVAVRNFQSRDADRTYSILELVTAVPAHYALGTSAADTEKAFPGFVVEAAKSAKLDWEQEVPVEHTTKIRTEAIPTGLQIAFNSSKAPRIEADSSLAMIGEEAFLLTNEMVSDVINRGLTHEGSNTIAPCRLSLNKEIEIRLKVDDLLRTHFGVFGFTGSGKSNLLSTLMSHLTAFEGREPIKIVLFDLMSEYTALTVDLIHRTEGAFVLALDNDSVLGGNSTLSYMNGGVKVEKAAEGILRTLLLPKELGAERSRFSSCIVDLLESDKLRILDQASEPPDAGQLYEQLMGVIPSNTAAEARRAIIGWLDENITTQGSLPFEAIKGLVPEISGYIRSGEIGTAQEKDSKQAHFGQSQAQGVQLKVNGVKALEEMRAILQDIVDKVSNPPPKRAALTFNQLVKLLNSGDKNCLVVVQSDRDDALRSFASQLINSTFNIRRRTGQISPSVLFIFDEADEFIPQGKQDDDSYSRSRSAINTLARRGRKFGMGMAIATQRIAYLDTSIMAQPHTYFISKLPRAYDREAMSKAFGITDEMMRKTLKFTKGQWLLVSFDATGLENIPIPVQLENANKRVLGNLVTGHDNLVK